MSGLEDFLTGEEKAVMYRALNALQECISALSKSRGMIHQDIAKEATKAHAELRHTLVRRLSKLAPEKE